MLTPWLTRPKMGTRQNPGKIKVIDSGKIKVKDVDHVTH